MARKSSSSGAGSSCVARRGLLAGVALLTGSAMALPVPQSPEPAAVGRRLTITAMAARVQAILAREAALDQRWPSECLPEVEAEEAALMEERTALQNLILSCPPANATEAMIVIMHGVDRIALANSYEARPQVTMAAERAIGESLLLLARFSGCDLLPFGSDTLLPAYIYDKSEGRA